MAIVHQRSEIEARRARMAKMRERDERRPARFDFRPSANSAPPPVEADMFVPGAVRKGIQEALARSAGPRRAGPVAPARAVRPQGENPLRTQADLKPALVEALSEMLR